MDKEAFIRAHEELIAAYIDTYGVEWTKAYEATADAVWGRLVDQAAARVDALKDELREKGK